MRVFGTTTVAFLRREWRFLSFGFLLAFWSSPGQTYVISLFGAEIMANFGLSHGEWGTLYMYATIASAVLLLFAGRLVDKYPIALMAKVSILALALAALLFPLAAGPMALFFGFLGLRFTGQGMLSHISATALSRQYEAERGRAVAIGALGFSAGQALFPPLVVLAMQYFPWRHIWFAFAALAVLTALPLIRILLQSDALSKLTGKAPGAALEGGEPETASALQDDRFSRLSWTRRQVLRDLRFYLLIPLMFGQSALGTALTFHQVHLVALKGWSMTAWSAGYSFYALVAICANLIAGGLIDRHSARVLTPFAILPMGLAFLAFAGANHVAAAGLVLGLTALANATLNACLSALWVEFYGVRHLGAVRSLSIFVRVFGSAVGPMAFGLALDLGVGITGLMVVSAILIALSSGFAFAGLYGPISRRTAPPA